MQTDITDNWLENLKKKTVERVKRGEIAHAQKLKHFKVAYWIMSNVQ